MDCWKIKGWWAWEGSELLQSLFLLERQHPAWGHIEGQITYLWTPSVEVDGGPRICPRCLVHMSGSGWRGKAGGLVVPEERALMGWRWGEAALIWVPWSPHGDSRPDSRAFGRT